MQYTVPEPKTPPKVMVEAAKAERNRRKACHGSWVACSEKCEG